MSAACACMRWNLYRGTWRKALPVLLAAAAASAGTSCKTEKPRKERIPAEMTCKMQKTDEEWRKILTPEQYEVTRLKGTERAGSGVYTHHKGTGVYTCVCCGEELFLSDTKYDSGSGWPSFWKAIDEDSVAKKKDTSYDMERVEILCSNCGAHLGHVFEDGPKPTGMRYCVNSVSLKFREKQDSGE